jgi:predicted permease
MNAPKGRVGPPRLLQRWLGACIPDGASGRDNVLGDLHEEYVDIRERSGDSAADAWYALQLLLLGIPWIGKRALRRVGNDFFGITLDARASFRGLRRQPALVAVSVLSLAFGTGLVSAAVTLVNGAWYAPLPWASAHRMVDISDTHPTELRPGFTPGASLRAWEQWRADLPAGVFERLEAGRREWIPIRIGAGAASTLRAQWVSGGYSDLFELQPRIGRLVSAADVLPGAEPVAVLSEGLWQTVYGASADVIGTTIEVDGTQHTVVGVLRGDVRTVVDSEVILPLPPLSPDGVFGDRGVQVIGVLAEGVSVDAADEAVSALASAMYAEAEDLEEGWSARVIPLRTFLASRGVKPLSALSFVLVCTIVLFVAALNLASLLLARTANRARELGVRAALGAGGARIARAALMDGLVLAAAGGLLGLAVVVVARNFALARFAAEIPSWASFPIDFRVLAASLVGTTATALVVSLLPIVRAVAIGREAGLANTATGHSRQSTSRGQNLLLGGQIALALVLVTASYGTWATFATARDFDRLGYRWEGITGVIVEVDQEGPDATALAAERVQSAALAHARILDAVVTRSIPLVGGDRSEEGTTVSSGGAAELLLGPSVPRSSLAVGPGYFELNEIEIVAGRPITSADHAGASPAVVVSADAAPALWPGEAPGSVLGKTVELARGGVSEFFTVVGISAPVTDDPTFEAGRHEPRLYLPILQTPDALYGEAGPALQLRVATGGTPLTRDEWVAWASVALPGARISRVFQIEEILRQWVQPVLVIGTVLAALALLVLALVAIGIYGTVSYRIASIQHEIGVRIALGADARQVVRAVVAPLTRVVAISVACGSVFALATVPVLAAGGLPVTTTNGVALLAVSLMTVGATAVAAWGGPLRRALQTDPSLSLRAE